MAQAGHKLIIWKLGDGYLGVHYTILSALVTFLTLAMDLNEFT